MALKKVLFIVFCVLNTYLAVSQIKLPIKEIGEKYVGRYVSDKNIEIKSPAYDISLLVNKQGYCYATEFSIGKILNKSNDLNLLNTHIGQNLVWRNDSSMIYNSLNFLEFANLFIEPSRRYHPPFESLSDGIPGCIGYASNERYNYIVVQYESGPFLFITQNKEVDTNLHREVILYWENILPPRYEINQEYISVERLDNPVAYFESDDFKALESSIIQKQTLKSETENKLLSLPLSTFKLPYGFYFGMSQNDFFMFLKSKFSSVELYEKNIIWQDKIPELIYEIKDNDMRIKIKTSFYSGKLFSVSYLYNESQGFIYVKLFKKVCELKNKFPSIIHSNISCNYQSDEDILDVHAMRSEEFDNKEIVVTCIPLLQEIENKEHLIKLEQERKLISKKKNILNKL